MDKVEGVVGGSRVWVSMEFAGTYSFDTARGAWAKQGDWALPFRGLAEYVPEYKLWFGLSSSSREKKNGGSLFLCAGEVLRAEGADPAQRLGDLPKPPKEWIPVTPYPVHLGSGGFCIARFLRHTGYATNMLKIKYASSYLPRHFGEL